MKTPQLGLDHCKKTDARRMQWQSPAPSKRVAFVRSVALESSQHQVQAASSLDDRHVAVRVEDSRVVHPVSNTKTIAATARFLMR